MKLLLRLFWLILTQSRRSRVHILDTVDTPLRVFPNDLDILMHVNNGVYLTYADLGRTDLMLRSGVFKKLHHKGWYPVVAEESIRFRRSLTLGQRFTLQTRIVGWDERSIYMQQDFMQGENLMAQAFIDGRFLARSGGKVSAQEMLEFLEIDLQSPPLPAPFQRWVEAIRLNEAAAVKTTKPSSPASNR